MKAKARSHDKGTRILAILSLGTTIYFVVAALVVHIINGRYDPIRDYMSDYVVGPGGAFLTSALYATAFGTLALAAGLWRALHPPTRPAAGIGLIVLFAISYAVLATFPTDILQPGELPTTSHGTIHILAAACGWLTFIAGAILVSSNFNGRPVLGGFKQGTATLAWLALAAIVGLFAVIALAVPYAGIAEKTFIAIREAWFLVVAVALLRFGLRRV